MPAVAAAPEQVDPDATFVALASSPLFVEEVDEPFTADATFIVKPQPEVDETFITPVPPFPRPGRRHRYGGTGLRQCPI
ncbi:MAG: hypothetical protein M5U34_16735 [Chloroflexi bacterium]|nr:hypothetical protein [Chloroflexota bacterium]